MSKLKKIFSNLYQWSEFSAEKKLNFNGYYLIFNGESVVIDPPVLVDKDLEKLKNLIKENSDSPFKSILLTNIHHERKSEVLKEIFRVPVCIHENDAKELSFKADYTFINGDKLFCGLKVVHLKNQKSPGESAFYLEDQKKMFIGDALIGGISGKLNMLPSEKFVNINEAKKSLHTLKNFDFDSLLLGDGESILNEGRKILDDFLSINCMNK
jgi:glyoxylase-like metal-dependent hydrolase (beta-lactamase superfamily II)